MRPNATGRQDPGKLRFAAKFVARFATRSYRVSLPLSGRVDGSWRRTRCQLVVALSVTAAVVMAVVVVVFAVVAIAIRA
jgi:hypothetical protein